MKLSKIQVTQKLVAGMHQHLQYDLHEVTVVDEEGNTVCSLAQFINKVNEELNIVEKMYKDMKKTKLEPSGAV